MIQVQTITSFLPVWVVLFPLAMTFLIYYVEKDSDRLRDSFSAIAAIVTFISVAAMYPQIIAGNILVYDLFEIIPGLKITFRVDLLGFSLAALSSFVWMLVTIYSLDYMSHEHAQNRYYPTLIFILASCLGIFVAGDLFTLFIFFELMSVFSYILVVHEETYEAMKAGYKYIIMAIIGGLALLLSLIITFEIAGTVSLAETNLIGEASVLGLIAFFGYLIGFGMKAGMFPLHVWLPDAHPVAPSPASALLSGIMLKTGAYGLIRVIFNVYSPDMLSASGWNTIITVLALITILLGSAVALTQQDLKRRLAYSSVGQMGYILLGMSLLTENAVMGNIFHIFSHALMKSCLFLAAGAVIMKTGKRNIQDLAGVGRQMPVTMIAFTVAAVAMIGVPPFNGFISKWVLGLGAIEAGVPNYIIVLLLSSLMNGLYYLPIIVAAFFEGEMAIPVDEVPYRMLLPMVLLAFSCLIFGLFPVNLPFDLSRLATDFIMGVVR